MGDDTAWNFDEVAALQQAFGESRRLIYLERRRTLDELEQFLPPIRGSESQPLDSPSTLVITGPTGCGKSALLAFWAHRVRVQHPHVVVIQFHIGASGYKVSHRDVLRHFLDEFRRLLDVVDRYRDPHEETERRFARLLNRITGTPILLMCDGLDQLEESSQDLAWMPARYPPNVRVILSARESTALDVVQRRRLPILEIAPLNYSERLQLSIRYLGQRRDVIGRRLVDRLARQPGSENPLLQRIRIQELQRALPTREVAEIVERFTSVETLEQMYDTVFERIEREQGSGVVASILSLLATSRRGLDSGDLAALVRQSRERIDSTLRALSNHLIEVGTHVSLYHDAMRRAIVTRYLSDENQCRRLHQSLARHFVKVIANRGSPDLDSDAAVVGRLRDAAFHYRQAHDWEAMRRLLCSIPAFLLLVRNETVVEVLACWQVLIEKGVDPSVEYGRAIVEYEQEAPGPARILATLNGLGKLFDLMGRWDTATLMYQRMLDRAGVARDDVAAAKARCGLGMMAHRLGKSAEAIEYLELAERAAIRLHDQPTLQSVLSVLGSIHMQRGAYDQALGCFQRRLECARQSDDTLGAAQAIGDIGLVYLKQADYSRSLECFEHQLRISEELGDSLNVVRALNNIGSLHYRQADYTRAMGCHQRSLATAQELGDHRGILSALGAIATLYRDMGDTRQAMIYYEQELRLITPGDRRRIAVVTCNIGSLYHVQGDFEAAMGRYFQALEISRELKDPEITMTALDGIGVVQMQLGHLQGALQYFDQALEISIHIGNRAMTTRLNGRLGNAHRHNSETDRAMMCFQEQLEVARELGDPQQVSAAIGSIGLVHEQRGEYGAALECIEAALRGDRSIGYLYSVTYWLVESATILLNLTLLHDPMPNFLELYVDMRSPVTWQAQCLQVARERAEECLRLSTEINKPDTSFEGRLLLARIDHAENRTTAAMDTLLSMLIEAADDYQQAELRFWLWQYTRSAAGRFREDAKSHFDAAVETFERLVAATPYHDYRKRLEALKRDAASDVAPPAT